MKEKLYELKAEAERQVQLADSPKHLQVIQVHFLGKKGPITEILKGMGKLTKDERPVVGQVANDVRSAIAALIEAKRHDLETKLLEKKISGETIDVTLPGRRMVTGSSHVLASVIRDVQDLFIGMGFSVAEGPEVEEDYYNFEALNLPKDHPARDMQDSFYLSADLLLRTQTSPVQARTLEAHRGRGPVKVICPGKVYRRDNDDATHSHQFMQIEGLYVDRHVRLSDLKGVLTVFAKQMFGADREIRLRPSFFPFTEPSVEMDISCFRCGGHGCSVCKQTGWIEILGAGMVHPNVLRMSGFDPSVYTGFAFGMGPERIAMLKYGIEDIRHFYTDDVRFLSQFKRA
ncbi:MAG: phenylalanine--tRNA ligase subunit alpha [Sporolactobacillus sp.]